MVRKEVYNTKSEYKHLLKIILSDRLLDNWDKCDQLAKKCRNMIDECKCNQLEKEHEKLTDECNIIYQFIRTEDIPIEPCISARF